MLCTIHLGEIKMIISSQDQEIFINSHAVRYYKIVKTHDQHVLNAYMTRGESVTMARGPKDTLVNLMRSISEAANNGDAYYEIKER